MRQGQPIQVARAPPRAHGAHEHRGAGGRVQHVREEVPAQVVAGCTPEKSARKQKRFISRQFVNYICLKIKSLNVSCNVFAPSLLLFLGRTSTVEGYKLLYFRRGCGKAGLQLWVPGVQHLWQILHDLDQR